MPDNTQDTPNLLSALRETYGTLEVHEIPAPNEVPLLLGALVKEAQNAVSVKERQQTYDPSVPAPRQAANVPTFADSPPTDVRTAPEDVPAPPVPQGVPANPENVPPVPGTNPDTGGQ